MEDIGASFFALKIILLYFCFYNVFSQKTIHFLNCFNVLFDNNSQSTNNFF